MKLDAKQKNEISQLVFSNVKYNETYLEVMDHVFSSMEAEEDENITFHQKLNQIWNDDFGGYENLPYLEKERKTIVNSQISKKYWSIFKSYFKLPLAISTVIFSLAFYLISYYFISNIYLFFVLIISVSIPTLVSGIMYLWVKKYDFYKPSIRDKEISKKRDFFYRIIYGLIVVPISIAHVFYNFNFSISSIYSPIYILLIVIFCVHTLSYFKLYKETFKMELASK